MNDDILNKDLASEPVTIETKKPILDKLGRAYTLLEEEKLPFQEYG